MAKCITWNWSKRSGLGFTETFRVLWHNVRKLVLFRKEIMQVSGQVRVCNEKDNITNNFNEIAVIYTVTIYTSSSLSI